MEFEAVVRRRKMIRNYSAEPVPRATLERIVARARTAPSAGFSQGVRMVVATDAATRRSIAELADEPYYLERGYEPWISRAPVHIVVAMREEDYHDRYREADKLENGKEIEWPVPWWWVDAGQAMVLLLLAVVDEGLGAGLFTLYPKENNDRLRDLLGMPADLAVVGVIAVGHPAQEPLEKRRRKSLRNRRRPLEQVVRWEHW